MTLRSTLAAALTLTTMQWMVPAVARAQETRPPPTWLVPSDGTAALRARIALSPPPDELARSRGLVLPGATMTDIRLSSGAKTAIIVGAIVGGILIIAGVIVIANPGHHIR